MSARWSWLIVVNGQRKSTVKIRILRMQLGFVVTWIPYDWWKLYMSVFNITGQRSIFAHFRHLGCESMHLHRWTLCCKHLVPRVHGCSRQHPCESKMDKNAHADNLCMLCLCFDRTWKNHQKLHFTSLPYCLLPPASCCHLLSSPVGGWSNDEFHLRVVGSFGLAAQSRDAALSPGEAPVLIAMIVRRNV